MSIANGTGKAVDADPSLDDDANEEISDGNTDEEISDGSSDGLVDMGPHQDDGIPDDWDAAFMAKLADLMPALGLTADMTDGESDGFSDGDMDNDPADEGMTPALRQADADDEISDGTSDGVSDGVSDGLSDGDVDESDDTIEEDGTTTPAPALKLAKADVADADTETDEISDGESDGVSDGMSDGVSDGDGDAGVGDPASVIRRWMSKWKHDLTIEDILNLRKRRRGQNTGSQEHHPDVKAGDSANRETDAEDALATVASA